MSIAKKDIFTKFCSIVASKSGSPISFVVALIIIIIWALSGFTFHYSDTWQLVINTGTTIVTFMMVFLIQNTQNRDNEAVHLKIDELIYVTTLANNKLLNVEDLTQRELDEIKKTYIKAAQEVIEDIEAAKAEAEHKEA